MAAVLIAVIVVLMAAFSIGRLTSAPADIVSVSGGGGASNSTDRNLTIRPGEGAAQAVRFLRSLRADPPPPPPPPAPPPPPPPPPPDVAVVFKAALRGVERDAETGDWLVLLEDATTATQITKKKVGASFGDGWRISEIAEFKVVLRKGADTRVIGLYG